MYCKNILVISRMAAQKKIVWRLGLAKFAAITVPEKIANESTKLVQGKLN